MTKNELKRQEQCMSSLDIAAVTGKEHKNVLRAIREMEPAWEKECGLKFELTSERVKMPQGGVRLIPVFQLTKTESLYVATKFNDEARARLVLRWEQLEREARLKTNERRSEQKLLVTEAEIMHKSDEIRRDMIAEENAESDGCMTISQIAQMMGTTTKALNKLLMDMGIQFWNGGRYKLTKQHQNAGYAKDRMFHYYALDGEKKQRAYLVWTPVGMEMIRSLV
jgi:phage regulator Rha-like protein